jgi:pantothenate kinase type III
MTTECQKSKETPAKCALFSGKHTGNYKGCTIYSDLQNARSKLSNRNQQTPEKQTIPQNNTNPTNSQHNIQNSIIYSQVISGNNMNNPKDKIGIQLNTFLHEFKAMFTQLINQNSMILSMLTTVINNKLNNEH